MDFKTASRLGSLLAKEYAEDMFFLLVNYRDISASEAASRLNLHIRTAQDFLEALTGLDILESTEVYEKKRPYNRYTLKTSMITMEIDLLAIKKENQPEDLSALIRERVNAGVNFSLTRSGDAIGHFSVWAGDGRDRRERRFSLTSAQGRFLYHLPFPNTAFQSVVEIMHKAKVTPEFTSEILDIVAELVKLDVIEKK